MSTFALISAVLLVFESTLLAEIPKDITKIADIADYERGIAAATNDFGKGVMRYEIVGLPGLSAQELKHKAKNDYNIDIVFHGCIPGPRVYYDRGYLDTVVESLKKKFGFDPVRKLDEELRKSESMKSRTNQPSEREPSDSRH